MRMTPKQLRERRQRIQRAKELARMPVLGLSAAEIVTTAARMELYDSLDPEVKELVAEYGLKRGIDAGRLFYGRWEEARKYLEAERQRNEALRWQRYGGRLPVGS